MGAFQPSAPSSMHHPPPEEKGKAFLQHFLDTLPEVDTTAWCPGGSHPPQLLPGRRCEPSSPLGYTQAQTVVTIALLTPARPAPRTRTPSAPSPHQHSEPGTSCTQLPAHLALSAHNTQNSAPPALLRPSTCAPRYLAPHGLVLKTQTSPGLSMLSTKSSAPATLSTHRMCTLRNPSM